MQPTLLVKSNRSSQAINSISLNTTSPSKRHALVQPLKSAIWAAAFGSLFIFAQTYALSLQNLQLNSALGEPLDAIVMVKAAPGEVLRASCIRTGSDAASGLPGIRGVQLSLSRQISPGTLKLTTRRPVTEPMSEVVVHIECPGAPSIKRSFLIMLDPRGATLAATPISSESALSEQGYEKSAEALNPSASKIRPLSAPVISSTDNRINVRSRQVIVSRGTPVDAGSDYVVVSGDALSTIAARIKGRDYGTVWSWAATIQSANPHAFINGNPNELIAGSKLYVPNTLAAGTAGLTVPRATNNAAARSTSRYSNRFSTRTNELATPAPDIQPSRSAPIEPPITVSTQQSARASGAIRAIQPAMVMATSFSSVSRSRLQQRNQGLIQAAPQNLPNFVGGDLTQSQMAKAAQDALNNNQGQPQPEGAQSPEPVAAAKPTAATAPTSGRKISLLGILGGLGLLAVAFFTGWWLSRRRTDAQMQELLEAKLNEERYRDRVRSGRQDAIREGLSNGAAAAGIQVTETAPEPTLKPSAFAENDDLNEVIDSALSEEPELEQEERSGMNIAEPIVDNDVPMIDPAVLEIDLDDDHELADIDLELLERDYAAQTETNTGLEDIAAAGRGTQTLADSDLDLEFPEDVNMRNDSLPRFDTLEFDPRAEPLDFDIGSGLIDDEADKTEALGLDLEEAGASIDAHLEELLKEEGEHIELDSTAEFDMNPTEHFEIDPTAEHEITDLVIENLLEDDDMSATSTRDAEEFYHLEASSIMNVGELDFEKGPDDETNILRFRQRNIRTGTDDSSGDED